MHQSGKLQVQRRGVPVLRRQRAVELNGEDGQALLAGEGALAGQGGGSGGDLPPDGFGLGSQRGQGEAQGTDGVRVRVGRRHGIGDASTKGEGGGESGGQEAGVHRDLFLRGRSHGFQPVVFFMDSDPAAREKLRAPQFGAGTTG